VGILSGSERAGKNDIGVAMVSNHDILIAASCSDRESPRVVCVELADVLYTEVYFTGLLWDMREIGRLAGGPRGLGFGGT